MKLTEEAQSFAQRVMSMNRKQRRKFSKDNNMQKIAGANKPYVSSTNKETA